MNRRGILAMIGSAIALGSVRNLADVLPDATEQTSERMPVLFVGHGNPMNAITDNAFAKQWERIGRSLTPRAILCVSAHWETSGSLITAMPKPKTIHDFGGFPDELFRVQYPAPGSPELASDIATATHQRIVQDHEWGLDHGAWSVLKRMFPKANIPVLQLSLDVRKSPLQHIELARELAYLRSKGVVIIGSGNIVHNLGKIQWRGGTLEWAVEFDELSKELITTRDLASLANYSALGKEAQLAIPTPEHYLPMLYALSLIESDEEIEFFNETIDLGSVSMRSFMTA
jgi:4,5-DOPA dioxygenase extradiol